MVTLTKDPDICSLVDPYTDEMLTGLQDVDFGSGSREVWSEMLRERDFDCSDCGIIVGLATTKPQSRQPNVPHHPSTQANPSPEQNQFFQPTLSTLSRFPPKYDYEL